MQLRITTCLSVLAAASAIWLPAALAQNAPPPAPTPQASPAASQAPAGAAPSAPAETAAPFPPVDPANFTATSPTKQTVEEFLKAYWGYDTSRTWQVQAIQPTPAQGVSHVIVLVKGTGGGPRSRPHSSLSLPCPMASSWSPIHCCPSAPSRFRPIGTFCRRELQGRRRAELPKRWRL